MAAFWFFTLILPSSALALRPFLETESAVPIDRGKTRLEIGLQGERESSRESRYALVNELTYGIINNLDFEVEVPYYYLRLKGSDEHGLGDVYLKDKIRFMKGRQANPLSIAALISVKTPSCNEDKILSSDCTGEPDIAWKAIASKEFFPLTVYLNLGFTYVGNPPDAKQDDFFDFSLAFDLQTATEKIRLVAELAGARNRDPKGDTDLLSLLVGMIVATGLNSSLDLGFSYGLLDSSPDYGLTSGVTHYF